jgi:predicted Zn-dependent protease
MRNSQEASTLEESRRAFEEELTINPGDSYAEYELGEVFWISNQTDEAAVHYARAVEMREDFVDALIALGRYWTLKDNPAKALEYLQRASRLDPENEVVHYRLSQAYRRSGASGQAEHEMAEFRRLRNASIAISSIDRQLKGPVQGQTIAADEDR